MKHWIKIVFFCGALLLIPVLTLLKEPAAASYYENRSLAVFPPFSMQEMLDGKYFPKVETWVGDHLAGRNLLLKLNTQKELALHSPVVNDTVVTRDILLPYHGTVLDHYNAENMEEELDMLQELNDYCTQKGIKFLYVGIPEQSNAFRDPVSILSAPFQLPGRFDAHGFYGRRGGARHRPYLDGAVFVRRL